MKRLFNAAAGAFLFIGGGLAVCNETVDAAQEACGIPPGTTVLVLLAIFLLLIARAPPGAWPTREDRERR